MTRPPVTKNYSQLSTAEEWTDGEDNWGEKDTEAMWWFVVALMKLSIPSVISDVPHYDLC